MRRQWFHTGRISTKENPADLNTKALSKERREFLMKRIGLQSSNFDDDDGVVCNGKKKQLALSWSWTWAFFAITIVLVMVVRFVVKLQNKMDELEKYKMVWKTIREAARLQRDQDPFCNELDPRVFAEDMEEEKDGAEDETMSETEGDEEAPRTIPGVDRSEEAIALRHRLVRHEEFHGAAEGDGRRDVPENDYGEEESFEVEPESPRSRHRRYLQSTMEEVSDPDE
eukprot:s1603_g4.t1